MAQPRASLARNLPDRVLRARLHPAAESLRSRISRSSNNRDEFTL